MTRDVIKISSSSCKHVKHHYYWLYYRHSECLVTGMQLLLPQIKNDGSETNQIKWKTDKILYLIEVMHQLGKSGEFPFEKTLVKTKDYTGFSSSCSYSKFTHQKYPPWLFYNHNHNHISIIECIKNVPKYVLVLS